MSTQTSFRHLFEPLRIGPVEVANRVYLAPHGPGYVVPDPDAPGFWLPAPNVTDYFVERARGGVGLIIQGGTIVHPSSEYPGLWHLFNDGAVDAWRPVVEAVHREGTKMFAQLMHAGHHGDKVGAFGGPLSASTVPPVEGSQMGAGYAPLPVPVRAMDAEDIATAIAAFATATVNARAAGYDGVELHGTHTYLVEQFYSPFFNKRTDEYGGSLDRRLRFLFECLEAIRVAAGDELAVGIRLPCDEMLPGGCDGEEMAEIVREIDASGLVDFIDLDIGTYHRFDLMIAPYQAGEHWAAADIARTRPAITRSVVLGVPGRFHDPAKAESLIDAGVVDMVGGVRGFFADPELARKAATGHADAIRPCIGLNSCVITGTCVMNPNLGVEVEFGEGKLVPATTPKRVLVVGAGPAGLEAARLAARRGHHVTVYEQAEQLGGALRLMAAIPGREHVGGAVAWWAGQLEELGVKVHLATAVTADLVLDDGPDAVVIATGAAFDRQGITAQSSWPIPGWDRPHVVTPAEVLGDGRRFDGTVVVLDEDASSPGSGVAEALAATGAAVEVVTRQVQVAVNLQGGWHYPYVMRRFAELGVRCSPNTHVKEIGADHVTVYDVYSGAERTIADVVGVVLVTGRTPCNGLVHELHGRIGDLRVVGDATWPRAMADATREGDRAGRSL